MHPRMHRNRRQQGATHAGSGVHCTHRANIAILLRGFTADTRLCFATRRWRRVAIVKKRERGEKEAGALYDSRIGDILLTGR